MPGRSTEQPKRGEGGGWGRVCAFCVDFVFRGAVIDLCLLFLTKERCEESLIAFPVSFLLDY